MTSIRLDLTIDANNQWFVFMWVALHRRRVEVRFKIDSGCNGLVLSHKTLKALGRPTSTSDLAKLNDVTGRLASGEKSLYKGLGVVALHLNKIQPDHICTANAICHATRETNDLLGTEVLRQFCGVNFNLADDKYMELKKP